MNESYLLDLQSQVKQLYSNTIDKAGKPYFDHLMRVASLVDDNAKEVAILHDVWETYPTYSRQLLESLSSTTVCAIKILTSNTHATRQEQYEAISSNPIALTVKLAVIWDLTRTDNLVNIDAWCIEKMISKHIGVMRALSLDINYLISIREKFAIITLDSSECFDTIIEELLNNPGK